MKLRDDYLLTAVGTDSILIPVGDAAQKFRGIVRLNETAAFLVERLRHETTTEKLADALCAAYEVSREDALLSIAEILDELRAIDAISEA